MWSLTLPEVLSGWACLSSFSTWLRTPCSLTCQQLSWAVRLYYSISCVTWGQQSKGKEITNRCHTSVNRDILFFTKLIQSSSVNSFSPLRKDQKKQRECLSLCDTSVCDYKADHKGGVPPLDLRQCPIQLPWAQTCTGDCWVAGGSDYRQVGWEIVGLAAPRTLFPPRCDLFSLIFLIILRRASGCHWVSL